IVRPVPSAEAAAPVGPEQLNMFALDEVAAQVEEGNEVAPPPAAPPRIVASAQAVSPHTNTMLIDTEEALGILARSLRSSGHFSFDLETTSEDPLSAGIVGMSLSMGKQEAYYLPVGHVAAPDGQAPGHQLPLETVLAALKPAFEDEQIKKD